MIELIIDMELPDIGASKRQEARIAAEAGREAMRWFVSERLSKRFDGTLRSQLRLEDRHDKYVNSNVFFRGRLRKYRRGPAAEHHFTGSTEKRAEGGRVYASLRRFGILITGLNPGYGRRRTAHINLRAELQRMSQDEQQELADRYARAVARGYEALWAKLEQQRI